MTDYTLRGVGPARTAGRRGTSRPSPVLESRTGLAVLLALALLGCPSSPEEALGGELETTDIGESVDSQIRPEDDPRGEERDELLVGMLPSDFPTDVWVYEPSTVLDFATADNDARFAVLKAREPLATVEQRLERRLTGDGWRGGELGEDAARVFTKGERRIRVRLEGDRGETTIRIEW